MKNCLSLEKLCQDLGKLAKQSSYSNKIECSFNENITLTISITQGENNSYILELDGPLGKQEADLESFEQLIEVLILFVSRQLIEIINKLELSPCTDNYHGRSEEILALFVALREFEANPEIPYSYEFETKDKIYEILSIHETSDHYKIFLSPNYLNVSQDKRIAEVKSEDEIVEKLNQLLSFEVINWLTPTKSKTKSAIFAQLSFWVLPAIAAGIVAIGSITMAWFYFNQADDWQTLEKKADQLFSEDKDEEAIKCYHRAIISAERDGESDEVKLGIYERLVKNTRDYASYDQYLKESAKLIVVAEILNSPKVAEYTMFSVAEEEYLHKNFRKSSIQLESVIPLLKKSRGKNFYGLIRAYELLGKCYIELNKPDLAKTAFLQALKVHEETKVSDFDGSLGFSNYYLGVIYKDKNQFEKAKHYLQKACDIEKTLVNSKPEYTIVDKRFMKLNPRKILSEINNLQNQK